VLRLFILLSALPVLLLASAGAQQPVRIAIIIDDLGNNLTLGREAINLPGALTYSVLPRRPHSAEIALRAHTEGKEVMLHLPMQTTDGREMGPGGLHMNMSRVEFARQVRTSLAAIPYVSGVNNHMGSLLTQHSGAMRWLMEDLACFDRLYFVDSRTDVRTVARNLARAAGLSNAQRDVFLDNQQDAEYVRAQLRRLVAKARRQGSAIGIGHPYPETLRVLAEELPVLAAQGIQLLPVSRLVERERNNRLWHASSSPLPTVAKNSRQ
jgi:polysaccharide deacetylase 2 family uncharacterized protein YibQ